VKVLIAEDQVQYTDFFVQDLRTTYGYDVSHVGDPLAAQRQLATGGFEVAIVDMLFDRAIEAFDRRDLSRNPLSSGSLIVSGLSVIRAALASGAAVVVWTSGEPNRRLHLVFAYEDLGVRAFCSKSSHGGVRSLDHAISRTLAGQEAIDVTLAAYLPSPKAVPLRRTLFREPAQKRAIWRALAVGARTREEVADLLGISALYIRNLISPMYEDLRSLNTGLRAGVPETESRAKFVELTMFASRNREFFLDEAVCALYP
jgi:DNA-binding NarL/FixJ family response regulator